MARPASQATAGYFPTPDHLVPAIASTVSLERSAHTDPILLDPCAGTGEALLALASACLGADPAEAARHCQAVEMEGSRAEALQRRLAGGTVHRGDALAFGIDAEPGASLLFLNPPYDTDAEHQRMEQRFLARYTASLAPGGALLFLVPHKSLAASADHLATHYANLRIWRLPDGDFETFGQVLVVAERRAQPSAPDRFTVQRLKGAAADAAGIAVLPRAGEVRPLPVRVPRPGLRLVRQSIDIVGLLERVDPFAECSAPMGFDRDARELLGKPLPVALPPRPAHIALALSAGLLNGRKLAPNDDTTGLPTLLAKGTFSRRLQTVDHRRNKDGKVTGRICVQQPRLDIHILRLDTLTFHQLALGTEPTDATAVEDFNTADLLTYYSDSLARLVRRQLPALHDPDDPSHRLTLPRLARRPFRWQAALIQAALKLLAQGENPQTLAEVGTGKTTVALSIVGALSPRHFEATVAELARLGFETKGLRPVRRTLVVCPPHLLDGWSDQVRAVLPEARVQVVRVPSDLDREADLYILSREVAKLGSTVAGVRGRRCPDCGHPLPLEGPRTRARKRLTCTQPVAYPSNWSARLLRDLGVSLYRNLGPEALEPLLPYLEAHPALHAATERRVGDQVGAEPFPLEPPSGLRGAFEQTMARVEAAFLRGSLWDRDFWTPFRRAGDLALLLDDVDSFIEHCRRLAHRRRETGRSAGHHESLDEPLDRELDAIVSEAVELLGSDDPTALRADLVERLLDQLRQDATWTLRPGCSAALHTATPEPRRYPMARYILKKKRGFFDFLILDEVHEFSTPGSAQEKAAHRLVELPGVPTITLTGSLMGGYASSLFANAWSLSARFRGHFGREERGAFINRYGFRKLLISTDATPVRRGERSFGEQTDRTDGDDVQIRRIGEAPGVLPLFILEHVLPTALVMHKDDLDDELPPVTEEPTPVEAAEDDPLDERLLREFSRLRMALVSRIQQDRGTDLSGKLWGAMAELPSYLDLANEECGEFVIRYPEDAGGQVVATGHAFPASWRSPKERWLLETLRDEIAAGRRVLVFLRHTGNRRFLSRLQRLILEELQETPTFLDPAKVTTRRRERWLNRTIDRGCRVLMVHPKAVQTGLNNLTAFQTAIWYEGPDYDARVTRQANGRPHRIGQTEPVRLIYPYYAETLQKTALDLVARKITASLQVDGLSLAGALEAAGALSDEDQVHASAALAIGQALYAAAGSDQR